MVRGIIGRLHHSSSFRSRCRWYCRRPQIGGSSIVLKEMCTTYVLDFLFVLIWMYVAPQVPLSELKHKTEKCSSR